MARDAKVLGAVGRIAVESIMRALSRGSGREHALPAAVCFVHRAGGSVNLNPHLKPVLVPATRHASRHERGQPRRI